MKRLLSLTTMLLLAVASFAHDFEVDGIYYNVSSSSSKTVSVTYKGNTYSNSDDYTGSVTIPETVNYSGETYSVTSIGDYTFDNCKGLTSVTIPYGVTSIGISAFSGCIKLQSIIIPESVTTIGTQAFFLCFELVSVTIPNSVTTIGYELFYNCSSLASITIPPSVTSISIGAFRGCTGLKKVIVSDIAKWCSISFGNSSSNPLYYAGHLYSDENTEIKELVIPEDVTSIGDYAFSGCSGLTSITIPSSVTSIGYEAFEGTAWYDMQSDGLIYAGKVAYDYKGTMPDNTSIVLEEGTSEIASCAFLGCSGLTNINIPESVTSIGDGAFSGCSGLTSINIPSNVTSISNSVFLNCKALTEVSLNSNAIVSKTYTYSNSLKDIFGTQVKTYILGSNITDIGGYAFCRCTGLTSITIPSSVTGIGSSAFSFDKKFLVKSGTKTHFNLLKEGYTNVYDIESEKYIVPYLSSTSTQTTLQISLVNRISEFVYTYGGKQITSDIVGTVTGLRPDETYYCSLQIGLDGQSYNKGQYFRTLSISPSVSSNVTSASSLQVTGSYIIGDATVTKNVIKCNGKEVEGKSISVNGLNPNTSYDVEYTVTVAYGDNNQYTATYTGTKSIKTKELTLTTEQPKVVSMGNVVVSATTNVDADEKNVGFEWRRTDWTSDFASNSGSAVVYGNTMEGYIRNLNTDKLWTYRAYYLSDAGVYYYGDWVGLDASNTSYFEPTVHTYADISTSGKVALIRGYVLNGTDKITVQGFKYWKTANKSNSLDIDMEDEPQAAAVSVPADAITETVDIVGAGQQLMNATLNNLDYGSTYQCVAFATTSENETFYGEVQSFTTEADPTGIEGVKESAAGSSKAVTVVACYDLNGKRLSAPQKGLNILRMSDGTTRKVVR